MKMNNLVIIIILIFSNSTLSQNKAYYINEFKKITENYDPENDKLLNSLVIAQIPELDKKLGSYLNSNYLKMIENIDQYAFLVALKTFRSQSYTTIQSYDLCGKFKNPIVKICSYRMNIDLKKLSNDEIGCSLYTTYDIYLWVKDNREKYSKYKFIDNELNIIKEIYKQKYDINIDTVKYKPPIIYEPIK